MTKKQLQKNVTVPGGDELLDRKGLADQLKRGVKYVNAMARDGFPMPGSRATLNQALLWLAAHPDFRQNRPLPIIGNAKKPADHPGQTDVTDFYTKGIPVCGDIKG